MNKNKDSDNERFQNAYTKGPYNSEVVQKLTNQGPSFS